MRNYVRCYELICSVLPLVANLARFLIGRGYRGRRINSKVNAKCKTFTDLYERGMGSEEMEIEEV